MEFLSKTGLSHLLDKLKNLFTTNSDTERFVIEAALKGRKAIQVTSLPTLINTNYGIIYHVYDSRQLNATHNYYLFEGDTTLTKITLSNLPTLLFNGKLSSPYSIPSKYWEATPFVNKCGYLSEVSKGETVNGYTRWLLKMEADTEDQKFMAGTSKVSNYYGTFQYTEGQDVGIWELWLPSTLAANSVFIDY